MFKNTKMAFPPALSKHLQYEDLVQLSTIYAAEFNNESIHDRVLVFEVTDEEEFGYDESCEDWCVDSSTNETDGGFVFKDSLSRTGSCSVGSNVFGNTSNPPAFGTSTSVAGPVFFTSTNTITTTNTGIGSFGFQPQTCGSMFGVSAAMDEEESSESGEGSNPVSATTTGIFFFGSFITDEAVGRITKGTLPAKFAPPRSSDTMMYRGITTQISTQHQCITLVKEYDKKSLEELRAEDYELRESLTIPRLHEILFDTGPNRAKSDLRTGKESEQDNIKMKDMPETNNDQEETGVTETVATSTEQHKGDENEETNKNTEAKGKEGHAENGEERDLCIDGAEKDKFIVKEDAKKSLEISKKEEADKETDDPSISTEENETKNENTAIPSAEENSESNGVNEGEQDDTVGTGDVPDEPDERKLYVHSSWLAVQSSYFRALFFPDENKELSTTEVVMKIPKRELQAHISLIAAMYNFDILDGKKYYDVVRVLLLAHKYDVKFVFRKCKYIILSTSLTLEISELLVKTIAKISNCEDIKKAVCDYIVQRFSPLDETWTKKDFQSLSKALLCMLLGSNDLVVVSENTVFVALMRWIEFRDDFEGVRSLLSLVRFKLINFDFLHDVVRNHKLAQKMDGFNEFLIEGLAYHGHSLSRLQKLKMEPTKRVLYSNARPPFSWEIIQSTHEAMLKQDYIRSDAFWVKGYEIILQLTYHENSNTFDLSVFVRNVNPGGYVEISWKAQSKLFLEGNTPDMKAAHTTSQAGFCLRDLACAIPAPDFTSETKSWKIDVWIAI